MDNIPGRQNIIQKTMCIKIVHGHQQVEAEEQFMDKPRKVVYESNCNWQVTATRRIKFQPFSFGQIKEQQEKQSNKFDALCALMACIPWTCKILTIDGGKVEATKRRSATFMNRYQQHYSTRRPMSFTYNHWVPGKSRIKWRVSWFRLVVVKNAMPCCTEGIHHHPAYNTHFWHWYASEFPVMDPLHSSSLSAKCDL